MRYQRKNLKTLLRRIRTVIKTIFGMPDYDRYLDHWYQKHAKPGEFPMSEKEYYVCALKDRYERGGVSRCC